jgi:Na+-driven multidrug efflux pump
MTVQNNTTDMIRSVFIRSVSVMTLSNISLFAGGLADSLLISRCLGTECTAAFGIAAPVSLIIVMISLVFLTGLQNVCSGLLAAGKVDEAGRTFSASVFLELIIAALLSAFLFFFSDNAASVLVAGKEQSDQLKGYLSAYMAGFAPGMAALCLMPALMFLMYLQGRGRIAFQSVLVQLLVNIAGDLLSVYVFHGGMLGMGIATSICHYCAVFVLIAGMARSPGALRVSFKGVKVSDALPVVKAGAPVAPEKLYVSLRIFITNGLLLSISGSAAAAAFSVMATLQNLYNSVSIGIVATTQSAASAFFGEKDEESLESLLKVSLLYGFMMEAAIGVLAFFAAPLAAQVFISDMSSARYAMTVAALRIFAFSIPLFNINATFQKYYLATGRAAYTLVFSCLNNLVFAVLSACILGQMFGTNGVWSSFSIGELCALLCLFAFIWIKNGHFPGTLRDYMQLPAWDIDKGGIFEGSVSDEASVTRVSKEASDHCIARGASHRTAMLIALCIEEMTKNIIQFGADGKKRAHIDVRIVQEKDAWRLRIRDDCKAFNPKRWLSIHEPEEPWDNIGIRMVFGLASDVKYINLLGMNQLVIWIGTKPA